MRLSFVLIAFTLFSMPTAIQAQVVEAITFEKLTAVGVEEPDVIPSNWSYCLEYQLTHTPSVVPFDSAFCETSSSMGCRS